MNRTVKSYAFALRLFQTLAHKWYKDFESERSAAIWLKLK